MAQGTVKWFNESKGYGFITADDGRDCFVHYSAILGNGYQTIAEGQKVFFDIVNGEKGPQASNVSKIGSDIRPPLEPLQDSSPAPKSPKSSIIEEKWLKEY